MIDSKKIAVIIPCYKVERHIQKVIYEIPDFVDFIIAINDGSPDRTGEILQSIAQANELVIVLTHSLNQGKGAALITGYNKAIELNVDIIVKIDGDGQMDMKYMRQFILPIINDKADFTKGNRFRNTKTIKNMPFIRRVGNIALSFFFKASSGYWNIFDPSNGYAAISTSTLKNLEFEVFEKRFFFEFQLLNELNFTQAVVKDISIDAIYEDEISNLSASKIFFEFPPLILKAFIKRIFYNYFYHDFNIGSIYLIFGIPMVFGGLWFGIYYFYKFISLNQSAPTGIVVIPTLIITLGFQLVLSFINFDVNNFPKK